MRIEVIATDSKHSRHGGRFGLQGTANSRRKTARADGRPNSFSSRNKVADWCTMFGGPLCALDELTTLANEASAVYCRHRTQTESPANASRRIVSFSDNAF